MVVLNSQELIKALTRWVVQQRNPYSKPDQNTDQVVRLASSSPHIWLEIRHARSTQVEISCIHLIHISPESSRLGDLRRECQQFNLLMERVRLPVIVWENRERGEFQLRWQETLNTCTDMKYVQHLLDQSLYLANALESRLGWALNSQAHTLLH